MDSKRLCNLPFLCNRFPKYWTHVLIYSWLFHSSYSVSSTGNNFYGAAKVNRTVSIYEDDSLYQQIPTPKPFLTGFESAEMCEGCRLGENGEMCSGAEYGECDCSNRGAVCRCIHGRTGDACQYEMSKISCEKMRHCILCEVHKSGPLTEGNDCEYFCHRYYPTPLIVKTLHFQDDEHLCSFIHHKTTTDSPDSPRECRYFFKYGPLDLAGSLSSSNFYIVAQQDMDCGRRAKFPPLRKSLSNNESFQNFAKNYEEEIRRSNDDLEKEVLKKNRFITVVIVFVFIALPFVTCVFALIYNFSSLPCGLCNVFRQSSNKYLRNVRPYPGFIQRDEMDIVTYV